MAIQNRALARLIGLPKDGIVLRSVLVALVAFVVASIGSIAYTTHETAQRTTRTIDIRLQQLLDTVQSTVRIACFLNDGDLAKEVSLGLLSNSEVLQVTVIADGNVLADQRRLTVTEAIGEVTQPLVRPVLSPFDEKQVVGEIRLRSNPEVIEANRRADIWLAAKQLLWQLLLMFVVIIVSLVGFIVRPISRMSFDLHRMDAAGGDRLAVPPGHDSTEIGRLVQDVNELADSLVTAIESARVARVAAESASVAKSAFLANMSHEIRTPLNAVLGLARIGARENGDREAGQTFQRILLSGEHLLGVINDILDFSKIEAGKLSTESKPFALAPLIADVVDLLASRASEKGLVLDLRSATTLPEWVLGDAMRIRQILVNLLSNAIKFTDHGRVEVSIVPAAEEICFLVRDEGIGMDAEQVSRLFRPFEQADTSTTRRFGGTGLGLAISMNLASLMGGGISVVSQVGRGSTFELRLPLPQAHAPIDTATPAVLDDLAMTLAGYRILAADDIEVNRLILEDTLLQAGGSCVLVENGQQALDLVNANSEQFDVVLMDVQMPVMDGHEATRRITALVPDLPVIGLTAHALNEERDKCLAAGMVDHVTKPIDPVVLVTSIRRWARKREGVRSSNEPEAPITPAIGGSQSQPVPTAEIGLEHHPMLDLVALGQRFRKPELVERILRSFLTHNGDSPALLKRHAAEADYPGLLILAHGLKGVLGNLCSTALQQRAAALEIACRREEGDIVALAAQLAEGIEELQAELRRHVGTDNAS